MKASQFYISTLKEAPAEAELASHKLMLRTGMIRRLASVYLDADGVKGTAQG